MSYEIFLGLRHTLAGGRDRFVGFAFIASVAGIALGVAALITVLAVMTGFREELRARILSVVSHVEASPPAGLSAEQIEEWRRGMTAAAEEAEGGAPNVSAQGLLSARGTSGAFIKGVLPSEEVKVSDFVDESLLRALAPGQYRALLGRRLAEKIGAETGGRVVLVAPRGSFSAAGTLPRLRALQVAGTFSTGVHEYDSAMAILHLQDAMRIYNIAPPPSWRFRLNDVFAAPEFSARLRAQFPAANVRDWTRSHAALFAALAVEKRAMFVIVSLIVAVAAFNIAAALVTLVRNKHGDIAILRTMGATSGSVMRLFLFQGAMIGAAGAGLGVLLGVPMALNAGAFVSWLERASGAALFPGNIYQLGQLPSIVHFGDVAAAAVMAFLLAALAAVYPSWRASRLPPAEALRSE